MTDDRHAQQQLAYLEALGITQYVSRADLPGAAPSRRVPVLRPRRAEPPPHSRQATDVPVPAPQQPGDLPPRDWLEPQAQSHSKASEPSPSGDGSPASVPVERFSLAAVVAGPYLWLEEIPEGVIGREQVALMRAMARALGAAQHKPTVAQFDWPLHNNRQLDQGEAAARAALGSFVLRQMEQHRCEAVILLGETCRQRLGELPGGPAVVATESTARMLADPSGKRGVWRDLQSLRNRRNSRE